jgi:aminobenzoyl-glutamate utilization protein B
MHSLLVSVATLVQLPPDQPFPDHRVIGNVYYVGSKNLASYLITTPEGHILINSGFEETVPLIAASIESLGFKVRDVKVLLESHAHSDHVAGHARAQRLSGAKVFVMRGDDEVIASGGEGQYLYADSRWTPCKVDRVLEDGDEVKLGGQTLVARRTPGHTRGCTTWTWRVADDGREYDVVVIGSPNVNPGYRLVGNDDYPEIADDFVQCFKVLKSLPCDVFLGAHGEYYGLAVKYERVVRKDKTNPFIDPAGYRAYVEQKDKAFRMTLAEQNAAQPQADEKSDTAGVGDEALEYVDSIRGELVSINQELWGFAELGLQEHRSAARLAGTLAQAGFSVKEGVSGMRTAFVAEYGTGKPVIGILAEYDALPELSQQSAGVRRAVEGRSTGHGCGHCALGTAAIGAALAVKQVYDKHGLKGTIRVYGTPAEETLIGKVYMTLDDQFRGLDICLHWHPGTRNRAYYGSTKAMISAKFTFTGLPAHASVSPDKGRSALDGVELMNVGSNYMREHIKETSRIHHVITNGGAQPNVVPATAQVWYYVRANTHTDAAAHFDWLTEIAEGAAKMSRTKVDVQIDTDCHEIIPNLPLSKLVFDNLKRVGPPAFDEADFKLARELQTALRADLSSNELKPLAETIEDLPAKPDQDPGSTDVGDISWHVPTGGLSTACFALESPGHSWQNVAAIGSPLGHKGMMVAAKVLALSALDLLEDAQLVESAKADFDERMKDRQYITLVPEDQKAPEAIR